MPFTCKAPEYGRTAKINGVKSDLRITAVPTHKQDKIALMCSHLWAIPAVPIPNFLSLTLTPSNQIIHPGRSWGIFKDWDGVTGFEPSEIPRIYADLDDASADMIQNLDDEIQGIKTALCEAYPKLDLNFVPPVKERIISNYRDSVGDPTSLRSVFNTNRGYSKGLYHVVPHPEEEGKVVPNTGHRFFIEDVPYGLCVLKGIGEIVDVPTPYIIQMIQWH